MQSDIRAVKALKNIRIFIYKRVKTKDGCNVASAASIRKYTLRLGKKKEKNPCIPHLNSANPEFFITYETYFRTRRPCLPAGRRFSLKK